MQLIHDSSTVVRVPSGTTPDYRNNNPLLRVMQLVERAELAADREHYRSGSLQYLFPFEFLRLYGPSGANEAVLDPRDQDDKNDFQKQNVQDFTSSDCQLIRGWVVAGTWEGPCLNISYEGGPDSRLSEISQHQLGDRILLWLRIGMRNPVLLQVPYNSRSDRYQIEIWGTDDNASLRNALGSKGQAALANGSLLLRPDLVQGNPNDFSRDVVNARDMRTVAPSCTMHPILPLHVELAWASMDQQRWDSKGGANYHYEFNMIQRGWDQYLQVGVSPNPHGGFGFLEFRNLLSNYFSFKGSGELARNLEPWNLNAFSRKVLAKEREEFMTVDYMDLHILKPECGIGLHRHRDNQEVFLMMSGRGYMVVGDWAKMDNRERCFEVRTLSAGSLAMLKGGNLHGLMNSTDEDCSLFMFGGYD
jgi:mannose-6-phosphate isomerase-like protein (cupin superfamily)